MFNKERRCQTQFSKWNHRCNKSPWESYLVGMIRLPHLAFLIMCCITAAFASTPNIVIIYMDDMGYADIGPFGAKG